MKINENNKVTLAGVITEQFEYSHETFGEKFYKSYIEIERSSGYNDIIPVLVSERICDVSTLTWKHVEISGTFRSCNKNYNGKRKLELHVFAEEITVMNDDFSSLEKNEIELKCIICKKPVYRKTPLGREIADLLVAVQRPYGKSDYIPCICWGRNAGYATHFNVGDNINLFGRIQSREYSKKISDTESETRVVYEVSANRIEKVEEPEHEN